MKKIFGSEVHDTALVFIISVIVLCVIGVLLFGDAPNEIFSDAIMAIAAVFTLIYWTTTYSKYFKK